MIKRLLSIFFALILILSLVSVVAFGDGYNTQYYRVNDETDHLSDDYIERKDVEVCEAIDAYAFDFPCIIVDQSASGFDSAAEYGEAYYKHYDFGYGLDRDGVIFVFDLYHKTISLEGMGSGSELFTDEVIESVYDRILDMCGDAFASGDSAKYEEAIDLYYEVIFETFPTLTSTSKAGNLPDWYPPQDQIQGFQMYHNADRPAVNDVAEMFTASEREDLSNRIRQIVSKHGIDLTIFTDVSTYGYSRGVYAADYYTFNGYGIGDEFDGSVLFISMEPGNRGWWTAAHGPCRSYYTEANINTIDDAIEPYMVDGDYYEAMKVYLDQIDYMYTNGAPPEKPWVAKTVGTAGIFSGIIGLISAAAGKSKETKKMNKVKTATDASAVAKKQLHLTSSQDIFLYKTYTRVKRPPKSSSSGGGHSSYSGSYHSSSGHSFSGGGRSF